MVARVTSRPFGHSGGVRRRSSAVVVDELLSLSHTLTHDLRGELGVIKLTVAAATSGTIAAAAAIRDVEIAAAAAERTLGWSLAEMKRIMAEDRGRS